MVEHLQQHVLSEQVLQTVVGEIRAEIAAQAPQREADLTQLEAELRSARAEASRLGGGAGGRCAGTRVRAEATFRPDPESRGGASCGQTDTRELAALIERIEDSARTKLRDLRASLADHRDLREIFLALFPTVHPGAHAG